MHGGTEGPPGQAGAVASQRVALPQTQTQEGCLGPPARGAGIFFLALFGIAGHGDNKKQAGFWLVCWSFSTLSERTLSHMACARAAGSLAPIVSVP